jgi:hypothetical protein
LQSESQKIRLAVAVIESAMKTTDKIVADLDRMVRDLRQLAEQLTSLDLTERRLAKMELARTGAHDPGIKAVWENKSRQLRDRRDTERDAIWRGPI